MLLPLLPPPPLQLHTLLFCFSFFLGFVPRLFPVGAISVFGISCGVNVCVWAVATAKMKSDINVSG